MFHKIDNTHKLGNGPIQILYPGRAIGKGDTGIGSIGRIDQADIRGGTTIKMHPHVNDEILSYFRTGEVIHTDSQGIRETLTSKKLMLMKAGKVFYHEEQIVERLEGLQIFIRPKMADDIPEVRFHDLEEAHSDDHWRHLASFGPKAPFRFTSRTEIYDARLTESASLDLPAFVLDHAVRILYIFQGSLLLDDGMRLSKGECLIFDGEAPTFPVRTDDYAELVLFETDENQECFQGGMYSGNQS